MPEKIWSLYRITNKINNKVYIGQATNISKRWSDHRRAAELNKPTQIIHQALIKHGLNNFEFEIIASCTSQDGANEIETELVKQYNCYASNNKGYNATYGGMNAPKSEEWRAHMSEIMGPINRARMASETPEQKTSRYIKVSNIMKGMDRIPGSGMKKGYTGIISDRRKFSENQIKTIIEQGKQGFTSRKLARIYNVNRSTISRILNGSIYKKF